MVIRIKNWHQFQHFKDRRPPWVKLYRDLLDDLEWHELDPKAAKVLVMLWLIASETDGVLPDTKKLAFRLRMSETATLDLVSKLSHWLEQDDIEVISERYQDDRPETETETETDISFDAFWDAYPRKVAKPEARKAFNRIKPEGDVLALMLAAIARQQLAERCAKGEARFVPHPSTWLNARRWEDDDTTKAGADKCPPWCKAAGFLNVYEAGNAGCYAHNAGQFHDGKRLEAA